MKLDDYQRKAFGTARIDWKDVRKRHIPILGVIGELGSLATEIKKSLRDGDAYTDGAQNLTEQFGDLMWYIGALASRYEFKMQALARQGTLPKVPRSSLQHIYAIVSSVAALVTIAAALASNGQSAAAMECSKYSATRGNAPAAVWTSCNNSPPVGCLVG